MPKTSKVRPGAQCGPYLVVRITSERQDAHRIRRHWWVRCVCGCGLERDIEEAALYRQLSGHTTRTDCASRQGDRANGWRGSGKVSGKLWNQICRGAATRRAGAIPVTIDLAYASTLFDQQKHRCALTGIELIAKPGGTASLDRIDNDRGYEPGNVRWVHRTVNMMKRDLPDDVFLLFCRAVATGSTEGIAIPEHRSIRGRRPA